MGIEASDINEIRAQLTEANANWGQIRAELIESKKSAIESKRSAGIVNLMSGAVAPGKTSPSRASPLDVQIGISHILPCESLWQYNLN